MFAKMSIRVLHAVTTSYKICQTNSLRYMSCAKLQSHSTGKLQLICLFNLVCFF